MRQVIELAKQDLLLMYKTFSELKSKYNKNFTYAVSFTKKKIADEALALIESLEPSDSYSEYESEKNLIIDKYGEKDESGALIVSETNKAIKINPITIKEFKIAIEELNTKYETAIKNRETDINNFNKKLDEKVFVEVEMVDWDDIPDDIDQTLMDALLPIVNKKD